MPGIIMHHHFATAIYVALSDEVKEKIRDKALYDFGSFGPDIFKTLNFLNKDKSAKSLAFASLLHKKRTKDFIEEMVKLAKLNKDLFPYLCGWISHYYLDAFLAPYIFNKSGYYDKDINNSLKYRGFKLKLERGIDSYIIENYYNGNPNNYMINHHILLLNNIPKTISPDLDLLYSKIYQVNNGYKLTKKALKDMKWFYGLIHDSTGFKNFLFNKFDNGKSAVDYRYLTYSKRNLNIRKLDIFNLKHEVWTNPVDENMRSIASFFDLMEDAKKQTIVAINALYNYIFLDEEFNINDYFANINCYTSLPSDDDRPMQYFNIVFK